MQYTSVLHEGLRAAQGSDALCGPCHTAAEDGASAAEEAGAAAATGEG